MIDAADSTSGRVNSTGPIGLSEYRQYRGDHLATGIGHRDTQSQRAKNEITASRVALNRFSVDGDSCGVAEISEIIPKVVVPNLQHHPRNQRTSHQKARAKDCHLGEKFIQASLEGGVDVLAYDSWARDKYAYPQLRSMAERSYDSTCLGGRTIKR